MIKVTRDQESVQHETAFFLSD